MSREAILQARDLKRFYRVRRDAFGPKAVLRPLTERPSI